MVHVKIRNVIREGRPVCPVCKFDLTESSEEHHSEENQSINRSETITINSVQGSAHNSDVDNEIHPTRIDILYF